MRVAILPRNIGSDMNYRVEALNKIGVEAVGYNFQASNIISSENLKPLTPVANIYNPCRRLVNTLSYLSQIEEIVKWADIIHWVYDLSYFPWTNIPLEFHIIKKYNKPGVVQWCGSDIRNYKIDFEVNPFFKEAYIKGEWGYIESENQSKRCQLNFFKLGFIPLEFIGMGHYIDKNLFKKTFRIFQLLGTDNIKPNYPRISNSTIYLLHAPSNKGAKGSKYVFEAINALKLKYDLIFEIIENLPRELALDKISKCDIFIDQLIAGSHGSAAVEAMSFGKPVVCYINEVIGKDYPIELPIVNANPGNIYDILEQLILNRENLNIIGKKSRYYVEKYHSAQKNAKDLLGYYDEIIKLHKV